MTYQIPPDISAKEKIVGGILTAGQMIVILACLAGGFVFTLLLSNIVDFTFAAILAVVIFLPLAVILTFVKIKGKPILKYIKLKRRHKSKLSLLKNHRSEADEFELSYYSSNVRKDT